MNRKLLGVAGLVAAIVVVVVAYQLGRQETVAAPPPQQLSAQITELPQVHDDLLQVLEKYRKIIVLFADEKKLTAEELAVSNQVGQALFHEKLALIADLESRFDQVTASSLPGRFEFLGAELDFIESDAGLFDADRLAFREILVTLKSQIARDSSLTAIKYHKRITEDLDALAEIERNYENELREIFGRFEKRAIEQKRERWNDYVAFLKKRYSREQVLKDFGTIAPYPVVLQEQAKLAKKETNDIFGYTLPKKTLVLSFDDGPHKVYTDEIRAILKQYAVPAVFFSVGQNIGSIDKDGKPVLDGRAAISKELVAEGFALGNHSFSHAQLSKLKGDTLKSEIEKTDNLLKAVSPERAPLFRFPYGARNEEGLELLKQDNLKSVMWNIDSLDWADPVPSSIADRVLRSVAAEGEGIILFHDIHERTVKALPTILERLSADGYKFAGWDGKGFSLPKGTDEPVVKILPAQDYGDSWAIVVGIDDYAKWPRLQYAVRDAQAVRTALVEKFNFRPEKVFSLSNAEATRNAILATFHDKLAHGAVGKNDRIFVFFAGHGSTRKLSSGRDLGYIIPADSDPEHLASDAIPMTEIQNIAESLGAKHVLFVMDACYSGLGLTRGAGNTNYLRDNAKRLGRQMLTAGGADQLVADGGPNGHSVFTWALLQGLAGKGDLNGDGLITATELAAYVAPTVAAVSTQTPAFGSLPGSEGGDFVFELPVENEFLGAQTAQLSSEAIAMNTKVEAAKPQVAPVPVQGKPASVTLKDLQGDEQKVVIPAAVTLSIRQKAQQANERGLQFYREKNYALAEQQFTESLKYRPDFALAANNLGFVYYKQEKYAEAVRWFENTLKMDPSRAIAYMNLGDALAKSGEKKKAKAAFKTFIELSPSGKSADYARQQLDSL